MNVAWLHQKRIKAEIQAKAYLEQKKRVQNNQIEHNEDGVELLLTAFDIVEKEIHSKPQGALRNIEKAKALNTFYTEVMGLTRGYYVIPKLMIYAFDVNEIVKAHELFDHAYKLQAPMPENFKSSLVDCFFDNLYDWAKNKEFKKESAEPYFQTAYDLIIGKEVAFVVNDMIKLKYLKLAMLFAKNSGDFAKVFDLCNQAEEMAGAKAQVATLKKQAQKQLEIDLTSTQEK